MGSLRLHSEKGVNPRMGCCIRCGKDVGLFLIGADESKWQCPGCDCIHFGRPNGGQHSSCLQCGHVVTWQRIGTIGEHEKLPMGYCEECEAEQKQHAEIVAAGGIYWKCAVCHAGGVIKADAEYAQLVRQHAQIFPPNPIGVEFDAQTCPVCNPDVVAKEENG